MVYLRIRRHPEAETEDFTWPELESAIKQGELGPKTLVCNEMATQGQWWTLDDLRIFHKNSPVRHQPGQHLAATLRTEERCNGQNRHIADQIQAYRHGNLIEDSFGLQCLDQIVAQPDILGVTRFFVLPSFSPEQVCTLAFTLHELRIDVATGFSSLWSSIPQTVARKTSDGRCQETVEHTFDCHQIRRDHRTLEPHQATWPFTSWQHTRSTAEVAPDCETLTLDGTGYRHKTKDRAITLDCRWDNPDPSQHAAQFNLIRAYLQTAPELTA